MLATQTTDPFPQAVHFKQWIKEKIAYTLKTLQKRYVTTDAPVTSDDTEANQLCCALEAVFIHGLRSKYIRTDGGRTRNRKAGSLPEPIFWTLLKSITHRDVILELEGLSFINSDVGRCRAWVRLALNDSLMECYMTSLLREGAMLDAYYQPGALLLDPEEREVLLSLLQGLASLAFQLSYKSAMLNEWTTTPLALAGLCCPVSVDDLQLPSTRRESWDTASQSSGSGNSGKGLEGMVASDQSLDTAGSSQLSCSPGSDRGSWCCQPENRNTLDEISSTSSQDLDVPSPAPGSMNDSSTHSSCDDDAFRTPLSNNQVEDQQISPSTPAPFPDTNPIALELEQSVENLCEPVEVDTNNTSPEVAESFVMGEQKQTGDLATVSSDVIPHILPSEISPDLTAPSISAPPVSSASELLKNSSHTPVQRTLSTLSRKTSSGSLDSYNNTTSWISEEDFYKPDRYESHDSEDSEETATTNGTLVSPVSESELIQSQPSVIHRRQTGLPNPFRGLLKLGQLERRAMGIWRVCHCELSPFELRLFEDEEERVICENCSLLRCESVYLGTDGRFRIDFAKKKLHLRAQSKAEAEDWVERIEEALSKVRHQQQEANRIHSPSTPPVDVHPEPVNVPEANWTRPCEPEPDAIKEAMVLNKEKEGWSLVLLSLSVEALRGYSVKDDHKISLFSHGIEAVRDVVPDVALGGPAFFKVLIAQGTLTFKAESGEEARSWRNLIRGALDLYLDEENGEGEMKALIGGNIQRLVQHSLKGDGVLLPHLTNIPTVKGLNAQSFRCAGCPKQIGISLGRARLCEFSGQYYCESCHRGDTTIIPSRMVHNWDLNLYEVSKQALKLMANIEQEPLLDLGLLNPDLFDHSETMATVQSFRKTLRLLGDYVLICRSGIRKKIEARLQERKYLLESSNLYSVLDLRQIVDGQYESFLRSLIQFSSHHVHHCVLCTQRGFICQICHADDIIFPFQCDSTSRCAVCKTVFHSSCKDQTVSCPRCERMQRYKERNLLK